jgi:hypothetical protein
VAREQPRFWHLKSTVKMKHQKLPEILAPTLDEIQAQIDGDRSQK